ncbi:MAG: proton-conducting transporter membrane subunit [Candidatus Omnitrophota bacterium]|nr:proton-conducting transporter membrane subunit [Candidatus Omnitrophota bacterium]
MGVNDILIYDSLSKLVGFFVLLFTVLVFIYSTASIKTRRLEYYSWFLLTAIASLGVVFSKHLIAIVIFWGFLGLTLFKLINLYSDTSKDTAQVSKKAFIIVGGSDGFLLLGFLLYAYLTTSNSIGDRLLIINNPLSLLSFLFVVIGCFAKAGCMPFHSWVPETAEAATAPVVAYLPASLDKLLGIYLLIRVVKDVFILDNNAKIILLVLGALTIICAVMMALVQHNIKKLLGYHAVSQVGYMVLGIATATPLGIAAGMFHMINHAIYKSCLFLCAGNVEKQAGSSELEQLGGLGKFMPITFIATLIASFSISGIPPLNGFISKWMVYQSLIDFMKTAGTPVMKLIVALSLIMALIGSGLTLASFLKLNYGVFLGNPKKETKEVSFGLLISPIILSLLCIIFGIFASSTILVFIHKSVGGFSSIGLWKPTLATNLIILGVIIGLAVFRLLASKPRTTISFTGGEELAVNEEVKIADFYNTIKELRILKSIYRLAEEKFFDIYEQGANFVFAIGRFFQYLHNGVLPTYLVWTLLGMIGLFFMLLK